MDSERQNRTMMNESMLECLLCNSSHIEIVDEFSFRDLGQLYWESYRLDIVSVLDRAYEGDAVHLYRCLDCALEFYPPTLQGNAKLYEALGKCDYYYLREKWEFNMALEEIQDGQNILEIGCGQGHFLDLIRRVYSEKATTGLESNVDAVRMAQEKGLNVQARAFEEFCRDHKEAFDVACAFQLLEHLSDPHRFLESIFLCVKEGGLCILTVPNAQGFAQYAVNDLGNMPPHHISRWRAEVMRNIAGRYGGSVKRILEEPVADYHKGWYRDTLMIKFVSVALGIRPKRIELGPRYRMMRELCRCFQTVIPSRLWRYGRYPGHSLYVSFRKQAS